MSRGLKFRGVTLRGLTAGELTFFRPLTSASRVVVMEGFDCVYLPICGIYFLISLLFICSFFAFLGLWWEKTGRT